MEILTLDQKKFLEQHLSKEVFKARITLGHNPYGSARAVYFEGILLKYIPEKELIGTYQQEFNKRKYFY